MRILKLGSILMALGLVLLATPSLSFASGLQCSVLFRAPPSKAQLETVNLQLERLVNRMTFTHTENGFQGTEEDLKQALELAAEIFRASSTAFTQIKIGDASGLEITPDEKAPPGWNKMAASIQKNYGARLIFSPFQLSANQNHAEYDREQKIVFISRESLREGRSERHVLHEIGHMKSEETKINFPNLFSGFVETSDSEKNPVITPGVTYYPLGMDLDEIPRMAQDFDRLARELKRTTTSREAKLVREEMKTVAMLSKDILANTSTLLQFENRIAQALARTNDGGGPVLLEDGTAATTQAAVFAGNTIQVITERFPNNTLRIRLEDSDVMSEIWVKGDPSWAPLLMSLRHNSKQASKDFKTRFNEVVKKREADLRTSFDALALTTQSILASTETVTNDEMAEVALQPRRVIAPHLAKRR